MEALHDSRDAESTLGGIGAMGRVMKGNWAKTSIGAKRSVAAGRLTGTLILIVLTFGLARPVLAQRTCSPANLGDTCPITGTAGLETGLWDLGFFTLDRAFATGIEWGDGQESAGLIRCFDPGLHPKQCHVYGTHAYTAPGTYTIRISYVPGLFSDRQTAMTRATISAPGDFVILSIGDSVGSGEGNPPVQYSLLGVDPLPPSGKGFWGWDDPGSAYCLPPSCASAPITQTTPPEEAEMLRNNCHRSFLAGPALAAGLIARTNPATFVHFACSGASVGQIGMPESDYPGRSNIVQQLKIARKHLPRIDVLLISGGFNNMTFRSTSYSQDQVVRVGFGKLVMRCLNPLNPCQEDPDFTTDINDSIHGNPDRVLPGHEENRPDVEFRFPGLHREYQDLDKEIHCINPADDSPEPDCSEKQIPKLVLITEFFDPTHDQNGDLGTVACLGVPRARWAYLEGVITDVNLEVRNSPWHAVIGIQDDFLKHGLCADDADRWVVRPLESEPNQNDASGTGHPTGAGHADYRDRIYAQMIQWNPPVTTASAMAGGGLYAFGTWTDQDVEMTLSAKNLIMEAGVKQTYYAVDNPSCNFLDVSDFPNNPPNCSIYQGPFTISTSGQHTVTFFSLNGHGNPEPVQTAQVWIDLGAPLQAGPGLQIIHRGQNAVYNVTVGHTGWDGPVVNLSCETDAPQATCSVTPDSVSVDGANTSAATVATAGRSIVNTPKSSERNAPFGPLAVLRIALALAVFVLLAAMATALRCKRWTYAGSFAGLAVLLGLFFAGCGSASSGTKSGTYNVVITGTSGDTSHTSHVIVVVQ